MKKVNPKETSKRVIQWMFGDHGPFGWNDEASFQDDFDRMSEIEKHQFIRLLIKGIYRKLVKISQKGGFYDEFLE